MKPPSILIISMLLSGAPVAIADPLPVAPLVTTTPAPRVPAPQLEAARQAKDYFDSGNYRAAETIYQSILAAAPNNPYVLLNLGVAQFRRRLYREAAKSLRCVIELEPNSASAHHYLALTYSRRGLRNLANKEAKAERQLTPHRDLSPTESLNINGSHA